MSVKLRLRRLGRRKKPIFSVVATDSRNARDGRYIEDLGRYHPLRQPSEISLEEGRVLYWLREGAQPSDTVRSILSKQGLMLAFHLEKQGKSEDEIRQAVEEHREKQAEKGGVKLTPAARRRKALEEERRRVEEEEAEARRREEEAQAAAEAEEEEEQASEEERRARARAAVEAKKAEEEAADQADEESDQTAEATDVEAAEETVGKAEAEDVAAEETADQEETDEEEGKE